MISHIVRYMTSLFLVIGVLLSPNIGLCADVFEFESEIEELCVAESQTISEIAVPSDNSSQQETFHNHQHISKSKNTYEPYIFRLAFNVIFCVFRE